MKTSKKTWWGVGILASTAVAFVGGLFAARKYIVAKPGTWAPIFADSADAIAIAGKPADLGDAAGALTKGQQIELVVEAKGTNDVAWVTATVTDEVPTIAGDLSARVVLYGKCLKASNKAQPLPPPGEKWTILAQHVHAIRKA